MKLSVKDRLGILSILPREGGMVTLRVVKDLRDKLPLTQEEIKAWGFKDGTLLTKEQEEKEAEIEITLKEEEVIVAKMTELERTQRLPIALMDLWVKLVEEKIKNKK